MSRVVVIGSINLDVVATTNRLPRPGETVIGNSLEFLAGGKGANQGVAAARAGADVQLVGALGSDESGLQLENFLVSEGIITSLINHVDGPTGTAMVTVDEDGENTITVIAGANASVDPALINDANLAATDILLIQNEIPESTIDYALNAARTAGATTIYNPAPYRHSPATRLAMVDYFIVNQHEFADFMGKASSSTPEHVRAGLAKAPNNPPNIIVTLGQAGLIARIDGETIQVTGHKVKAVDATGAGDCFCGNFTAALAVGVTPTQALKFANAAAALSVQRPGTGPAMPYRAEIEDFLERAGS